MRHEYQTQYGMNQRPLRTIWCVVYWSLVLLLVISIPFSLCQPELTSCRSRCGIWVMDFEVGIRISDNGTMIFIWLWEFSFQAYLSYFISFVPFLLLLSFLVFFSSRSFESWRWPDGTSLMCYAPHSVKKSSGRLFDWMSRFCDAWIAQTQIGLR